MSEEYDAIVVGSGFGGSVMTYRLAKAGLRVRLLERGRAYPPGSFPRSPSEIKKSFWDPSAGRLGLFNLWSFPGSGALVSSGLGGGSLIYANVHLRKDEHWFQEDDGPWPVTYQELDKHYSVVERMLNVQPFPFQASTPKTQAMREAANGVDGKWFLPNLAVSFRPSPYNPGVPEDPANRPQIGAPLTNSWNLHDDAPRSTCRMCGECDIGCNFGSKNTLDLTILSDAMRLPNPPEISVLSEVRSFAPRPGGGYTVDYVQHSEDESMPDTKNLQVQHLNTKRLILAAGSLGTSYLLLKNRDHFPRISHTLGHRFSVNGDLLTFIKGVKRSVQPHRGPVITSAIRFADAVDGAEAGKRGFYAQEGGYPPFVEWIQDLTAHPPGFFSIVKDWLFEVLKLDRDTNLGGKVAGLLGPCNVGDHTLPILFMGRDRPSGKLTLDGEFLANSWSEKDSDDYYERLREVGNKIAARLGGEFEENLLFRMLHQVITAHPLGGCAMAESVNKGVVNNWGEVFNYPGLYIADGSVLPGSVGPNPALTIAALADRFADGILE